MLPWARNLSWIKSRERLRAPLASFHCAYKVQWLILGVRQGSQLADQLTSWGLFLVKNVKKWLETCQIIMNITTQSLKKDQPEPLVNLQLIVFQAVAVKDVLSFLLRHAHCFILLLAWVHVVCRQLQFGAILHPVVTFFLLLPFFGQKTRREGSWSGRNVPEHSKMYFLKV